jgi:hypothetical protein
MSNRPMTRKSKAFALVPLALLSGAWTASLAGLGGSAAVAAKSDNTSLPGGTSVPSKAIQAPASVPIPGVIAPSVPDGAADSVVASASTSGIPAPALSAYQRAAQIIDSADKTCNIPWELIAAIGRVESDHGRYDGNTLTADGISTPGIYGPELNGRNGTQAIADTDAGQLDHDTKFDRAVGPMQFIPSTWSVVKVDADGDGIRNPQDIDDASLATAVYLCSGTDNLSDRKGQEAAVYRYNHSTAYVNLVLRIMDAYTQGDYSSVPSGTYAGNLFSPSYSTAIKTSRHNAKTRQQHPTQHSGGTSSTSGGTTTTGTGSGTTGGTSTPGLPSTGGSGSSDAVKALNDAVTQLTAPLTSALPAPIVDTLSTLAEALNFCSAQMAAIPDPLNLLGPLKTICASHVEGKTESAAASLIPNTLNGILAWLR